MDKPQTQQTSGRLQERPLSGNASAVCAGLGSSLQPFASRGGSSKDSKRVPETTAGPLERQGDRWLRELEGDLFATCPALATPSKVKQSKGGALPGRN